MPPSHSKLDGQKRHSKPYGLLSSSSKSDSRKVCLYIVKMCITITHYFLQMESTVGSFLKLLLLPSQLISLMYQQPSIELVIQRIYGSFAPYIHLYHSLAHTVQIQNIALQTLRGRSTPLETCFFTSLPNVAGCHIPFLNLTHPVRLTRSGLDFISSSPH
jgi:hypothetical protein